MGGRLDSTNILTPRVSVITNISYDHTAILGDTLPKIAAEKCGIIKQGVPVVSAPQELDALIVIQQIAAEKGADLTMVGAHLRVETLTRLTWRGRIFASSDGEEEKAILHPAARSAPGGECSDGLCCAELLRPGDL